MDPVIHNVFPVEPTFIIQVLLKLPVNVIHYVLPTEKDIFIVLIGDVYFNLLFN